MSNVLRGTIVNPDVIRGKSAYEIAVAHGFDGTEQEWLDYVYGSEAAKYYNNMSAQHAREAEDARDATLQTQERVNATAESVSKCLVSAKTYAERAEAVVAEAKTAVEEEAKTVIGGLGIVQTTGESETAVMSQKAVTESIEDLARITTETECNQIITTIKNDGYYTINGGFVADVGRVYSIVEVSEKQTYILSTYISSTAIAGIIFRDSENNVIGYDLVGSGTVETISDYNFTIPTRCTNIIIQSAYNGVEPTLNKITILPKEACLYKEERTVFVGDDLLDGIGAYYGEGTGWSGTEETGLTHTAGRGDSLSFYCPRIEEGAIYLCDFDTTYDEDEFVCVGIGTQYRILVYKGITHIQVPLLAVGDKVLYFTPITDKTFTISNITLRKVVEGGNSSENLELYNTLTSNHKYTYGFWNVFLGKNTAENAVGSTRTLAIGYAALNALQGGHRNVALGTFTMSQMTGGENNVAIGADAMLAIKSALDCIAIGKGTMYNGLLVEDNVAVGHYALTGSATSSNSKRNVAVGKNAGWHCYGQDNTFLGYQAGYSCKNTNGNTCLGKNADGGESGNHNTCIGEESTFENGVSNSTAIGYYARATKSNQVVIGNGSVEEVLLGGKKIIFNSDGTVTWETLTE